MAAIVFVLGESSQLAGAPGAQDENAVRAAFVFNLTKFVEWPKDAEQMRICYVGGPSMGAALKSALDGKHADTHTLEVRIEGSEQLSEHCRLIYIESRSLDRARGLLDKAGGRGILTVGDAPSFAASGGMIGLVTQGDHIRLQVNLQALQAAQLKISSRLLSLATIVNPGEKKK